MRTIKVLLKTLVLVLSMGALSLAAPGSDPYTGSRFADVWGQVKSDPYATYPSYEVTLGSFGAFTQLLKDAAARTINNRQDLLPRFQKLIRPHGVCLKGTWTIDQSPKQYTGYFKSGSKGLVILRASVGLSDTKEGDFRAFGVAGKIFPTMDEADSRKYETANFFAIDDNAGTKAPHLTDVAMTNQPVVSKNLNLLAHIPLLAAIKQAQKSADSHEGIRQLYPIARLGQEMKKDSEAAKSPAFLLIQGVNGPDRSFADFRDELRVKNYSNGLVFKVMIAEDRAGPWTQIGKITIDESVASDSCDHRLHFSHPKWL